MSVRMGVRGRSGSLGARDDESRFGVTERRVDSKVEMASEGIEMWWRPWGGGDPGDRGLGRAAEGPGDCGFLGGGANGWWAEPRAGRICRSTSHPHCSRQPEPWGASSCFCSWLS